MLISFINLVLELVEFHCFVVARAFMDGACCLHHCHLMTGQCAYVLCLQDLCSDFFKFVTISAYECHCFINMQLCSCLHT